MSAWQHSFTVRGFRIHIPLPVHDSGLKPLQVTGEQKVVSKVKHLILLLAAAVLFVRIGRLLLSRNSF